jgi:hypothetical protein
MAVEIAAAVPARSASAGRMPMDDMCPDAARSAAYGRRRAERQSPPRRYAIKWRPAAFPGTRVAARGCRNCQPFRPASSQYSLYR